jgi:nitrogen fixation/metabolism regulation signal transduction histidine kinase
MKPDIAGRGSLERRLLIFFLLFWVVPTLLIAFFGMRFLVGSFNRINSPALSESMRNSYELAREYYDMLESTSTETCTLMEAEFREHGIPRDKAALRAELERITRENRVDFAAVYTLDDTLWVRLGSYPERPPRVDTQLRAGVEYELLDASQIALSDPDVVASGLRGDDRTLYVAGYVLSPGRIDNMRKTSDDLQLYRTIGLYLTTAGRKIQIVITALAVALVASSFAFARFVSIRWVRPIRQLAAATERVAGGDLTQRVDLSPKDAFGEIGTLASSFNVMTGNLEEAQRNLARTERIAAWREVARRLAHELKNPLTPIQVSIHRIKKRLKGDDEDRQVIEECLDSILKEVSNLRSIAEEFSTFAKLPEPRFGQLDVNEAIRSVLELYTSSLENIEVVTAYGERLPPVLADQDQIRSVFSNIIKNAIEAMPNGGVIVIITTARAGEEPGGRRFVRTEISDSGGGIPKDVAEQIFNPYFTTKAEGTGLGLALAYRIIQDHNGNISFTTSADGTTFAIDLPVHPG